MNYLPSYILGIISALFIWVDNSAANWISYITTSFITLCLSIASISLYILQKRMKTRTDAPFIVTVKEFFHTNVNNANKLLAYHLLIVLTFSIYLYKGYDLIYVSIAIMLAFYSMFVPTMIKARKYIDGLQRS